MLVGVVWKYVDVEEQSFESWPAWPARHATDPAGAQGSSQAGIRHGAFRRSAGRRGDPAHQGVHPCCFLPGRTLGGARGLFLEGHTEEISGGRVRLGIVSMRGVLTVLLKGAPQQFISYFAIGEWMILLKLAAGLLSSCAAPSPVTTRTG